jgi:hypothetical protein
MGTIKDLTDLVTQYIESVDDRKFAGELREIQKMIILLQREQASLQEQNSKLQAENIQLQKQIDAASATDKKIVTTKSIDITDEILNVLHLCSQYEDGASAGMIQSQFQISNAKAELIIGKLHGAELIDYGSLIMGQDLRYSPTQEGLELLDQNGLI